ncbi:translation elongation factor EF-1 subunit alpha [Candidatus Pacearchaeota archaeon CG_4_9_14_3_um_filter_31_7]|nr:MAG: translation elongation factor EF-1 subunit alpha [Candidatus Pacearchaeota archaeon CG_4_10_14_0_2_um_filter_31_10]PJA70757.1 MAG: translation elongation factor EF-1 subunit alpha [Candidatus Pacearchaeota archaeon CG_4_9_14_3_um_filter_31_7]
MAKEKTNFNVVFIGHVDHGKSTTIGRLLFDLNLIDENTIKKLRDEAEKFGKKGFEFAFVMDTIKEERERGVTIDLAYKKLMTDKFQVTIIDAPGHKDFVKNMITGASQADAAVLVVAAPEGIQPQTQEHIFLARTMGVKQMAVLINKMDATKPEYDQKQYEKVKEDLAKLLKTAGFDTSKINFIAGSAWKGDNIAKKSDKMSWYKGPTVREQLDLFDLPQKPIEMPMRMPIQDVYTITGVGTVPVGKIETGVMKPGQKVIILPGRTYKGILGEIKTIETHHESLPSAEAGDNVGVNIRGIGKQDITRGDVICDVAKPATMAEEFTAQIAVINHPTVIAKGYTPVFHIHTAQAPCRFEALLKKIDPKTGEVLQENPDFLKNGDVAIVKIKPMKAIVLEKQSVNPHMARFAIRDAGATVAAGICIDLVEKKI